MNSQILSICHFENVIIWNQTEIKICYKKLEKVKWKTFKIFKLGECQLKKGSFILDDYFAWWITYKLSLTIWLLINKMHVCNNTAFDYETL